MKIDRSSFQERTQHSEDVALLLALSSSYYLFGQAKVAISVLELARLISRNDPAILQMLAVLLSEQGELDRASGVIEMLEQLEAEIPEEIRQLQVRLAAMQRNVSV